MPRRHPLPHMLPTRWLMTDERLGDGLWDALARLPRGSGVVFRHYRLAKRERLALFRQVARVARARRLVLVAARPDWNWPHVHGARARGMRTMPAHSRREAVAAVRAGADLVFASPVFPTRSHLGARTLGRVRLGLMVRGLEVPVAALGGMNAQRSRGLAALGVSGWAGIDAWARGPRPRR